MVTVEAAGLILPSDVLIIVMENLSIEDLINLSYTCKFVNLLVNSNQVSHNFGSLTLSITKGSRVWMVTLPQTQRSFVIHVAAGT